ncbi:glycine-rich domain-containing protein [Phenylobacterium soli]
MSGHKPTAALELVGIADGQSGAGSIIAAKPCVAVIYAIGGGASGGSGSPREIGGGGGAALLKTVKMAKGQTISWAVGAGAAASGLATYGFDGGDTTVTLPNGFVLTAGGGKAGSAVSPTGNGGMARGGDVNRAGGAGGASGSAGTSGGLGGGSGGATNAGGGGGGGAGFSDVSSIGLSLAGGNGGAGQPVGGSDGGAGSTFGAGGGGTQNGAKQGGAGASGRVLVLLARTF